MSLGFFSKTETQVVGSLPGRRKGRLLPPVLKIQPPKFEVQKKKTTPIPNRKQMVLDIECYINYFLVKFLNIHTDEVLSFEKRNDSPLDCRGVLKLLNDYEIITFNGNNYDAPIVKLALKGASNATLKEATNRLIKGDISPYRFEESYAQAPINFDHIDLIEITPGISSLKIYGGRLHCRRMQDLPFPEDTRLTEHEMDEVNLYCGYDLQITKMLFIELIEQVELRRVMSKQYGIDLMSKSDAQIAEEVIKAEIFKLKKINLKRQTVSKYFFNYKTPDFIKFKTRVLLDALDVVESNPMEINESGRTVMPKALSQLKINIGKSSYNMGIGGLHSTEKTAFHLADDRTLIYDWDVDSYYPNIILNCNLYPKSIGVDFLTVYRKLVTERLEAKAAGNKSKSDSFKIVVNGSFGKLGSPYSVFYSPELMIQVTITGQLLLLMLIESLELSGISVVSGNTDGVVCICPREKESLMKNIISDWEEKTRFKMSSAKYLGIYSRDVNNYIAIKENGEVKTKGIFSGASLSKNSENEICNDAMIEYLKYGTPFKETIQSCTDIRKFITVRSVKGGAEKDGKYLGKSIRWYHAKDVNGSIVCKTNGNKIPLTEGVIPKMNMGGNLPEDIDYDWYEQRCYEMFQ